MNNRLLRIMQSLFYHKAKDAPIAGPVLAALRAFFTALCFAIAAGCGGKNTSSNVQTPGGDKTAKDKILNTGAGLLQSKTPLQKFNVYLDGFHFYNGNINAQMEAHHYVNQLNDDVYQAIIFD